MFTHPIVQVPAKQDAVLQDLEEIVHVSVRVNVFARDGFNPFQAFLRQFFAIFAIDLQHE